MICVCTEDTDIIIVVERVCEICMCVRRCFVLRALYLYVFISRSDLTGPPDMIAAFIPNLKSPLPSNQVKEVGQCRLYDLLCRLERPCIEIAVALKSPRPITAGHQAAI